MSSVAACRSRRGSCRRASLLFELCGSYLIHVTLRGSGMGAMRQLCELSELERDYLQQVRSPPCLYSLHTNRKHSLFYACVSGFVVLCATCCFCLSVLCSGLWVRHTVSMSQYPMHDPVPSFAIFRTIPDPAACACVRPAWHYQTLSLSSPLPSLL